MLSLQREYHHNIVIASNYSSSLSFRFSASVASHTASSVHKPLEESPRPGAVATTSLMTEPLSNESAESLSTDALSAEPARIECRELGRALLVRAARMQLLELGRVASFFKDVVLLEVGRVVRAE